MELKENVSLAPFSTFRIGGPARYFVETNSPEELKEALSLAKSRKWPFFILGGGSNILISDEGFPGLVVKISLRGINLEKDNGVPILTAGAGELWDEVVEFSAKNGFSALEALSGIPGLVGATPIQNIGAYGLEIKDVIQKVFTINAENGEEKVFRTDECSFAYRYSFFKTSEGKKFVVTGVAINLDSRSDPIPKEVVSRLEKYGLGLGKAKPGDIREAVIAIRKEKLPPLSLYGTAGSFFKNPVIAESLAEQLKQEFSNIPVYPVSSGLVKVPAAFLIENAGKWKGIRRGEAGVYEKHALVLVNHGHSSAQEIKNLSEEIKDSVYRETGITLLPEVEFVGKFT